MTTQQKPLDANQKHMLRLVQKGADAEGWAVISKMVFPVIRDMNISNDLCVIEPTETGGRARLTDEGKSLIKWII